jgi:hypothetical protein
MLQKIPVHSGLVCLAREGGKRGREEGREERRKKGRQRKFPVGQPSVLEMSPLCFVLDS